VRHVSAHGGVPWYTSLPARRQRTTSRTGRRERQGASPRGEPEQRGRDRQTRNARQPTRRAEEALRLAREQGLPVWNPPAAGRSSGNRNASVAQLALAWLLHQPRVTSVVPGARRIERLRAAAHSSAGSRILPAVR
jgi:aryl-alcohol dehydrogenase-like predicted oxidoreductase